MQSNNVKNTGQLEQQPKANGQQKDGHRQADDNDLEQLSQRIVQLHQAEEDEEASHGSPIHRQMKIYLAKEIWFEMLAFVPRHQLGQIVPQIGNRKFAGIAQSFLYDEVDNKSTLGHISIYMPREEDATLRPIVQVTEKCAVFLDEPWRTICQELVLPDMPMPTNIKDFLSLRIGYLDLDVLNFLRQFQQNSLFGNVNIDLNLIWSAEEMDMLLKTLSYVLPLIKDNINSIQLAYIKDLRYFYNANSDMALAILKMPRILRIRVRICQFEREKMNLLNRWLYTPRDDGNPRVLILPIDDEIHPYTTVSDFIDNIQMEFSNAKRPVCFFIHLFLRNNVEWYHDICMQNGETKEKLVIKKGKFLDKQKWSLETYRLLGLVALISRYPLNASKQWIEANEKEALDWDFDDQNRRFCVDNPIENAIPQNFAHSSEGREAHYQSIRLCDCFSSANDGREDQGGSRDNDGDRRLT